MTSPNKQVLLKYSERCTCSLQQEVVERYRKIKGEERNAHVESEFSALDEILSVISHRRTAARHRIALFRILNTMGRRFDRIQTPEAIAAQQISRTHGRKRPSLRKLVRLADFFGPATRRQMKADAGDWDAQIRCVHKQHRYWTARWNYAQAWAYFGYAVVKAGARWVIGAGAFAAVASKLHDKLF